MRNRGRKESGDGDYRMMNIDDKIMIVDTVECRRGSRSRIDSRCHCTWDLPGGRRSASTSSLIHGASRDERRAPTDRVMRALVEAMRCVRGS